MKFYYKGKLVRTSKTHNYTHAVFCGEYLQSCSSSYEGALKVYNQILSIYSTRKENFISALKALNEGKTYYTGRYGREIDNRVPILRTAADYIEEIEKADEVLNNTHIEELEVRD